MAEIGSSSFKIRNWPIRCYEDEIVFPISHDGISLFVRIIPNSPINDSYTGIYVGTTPKGNPNYKEGERLVFRFQLFVKDPISRVPIERNQIVTIDHNRGDMGYWNLFSMHPGSPYFKMDSLKFTISLEIIEYIQLSSS